MCLRGRGRATAVVSALSALSAAVVVLAVPVPTSAAAQTGDTVSIVKDEAVPSNVEIAVLLSEATPLPDTSTVVIGRDDRFADSLASGVLQAAAPLLLTPPTGAVPQRVRDELERLAPERVILLGGTAALDAGVEAELAELGYATERRAGASRFETAVEVARTDAPDADTAILARAFPSAGATDETQAFADALAAGGLAAENRWPVLLTATDALPEPTRTYLAGSQIRTVKVMGGTAAISAAVEAELAGMGIAVTRVAGGSRAETAIEVAKERGADTGQAADHVVLVQGEGADAWAGGFAAAARSAELDAPIVLARDGGLPAATTAWLSGEDPAAGGAAFAQTGPKLTCVVLPGICEEARVALGLPPATRTYELLSGDRPDATAGGGTGPAASDDGQVVAFPLQDGEGDGGWHTYVHRDGALELVDVTPSGETGREGTGAPDVAVTGDGSAVLFTSGDQRLDAATTPVAVVSAYLRDLATGTTRHVSVDAAGGSISGARNVATDADGSVVAYTGQGDPGVDAGCSCTWLFIHDLAAGEVTPVQDAAGAPVSMSNNPTSPALSADGTLVAFQTGQALLPEDDNTGSDVYLLDRSDGSLELVSVAADGTSGSNENGNPSPEVGMSGDGRFVAFWYGSGDLVAGEDTDSAEVYLRDRQAGTTIRLTAAEGNRLGSSAGRPDVAADGSAVVFASDRPLAGDVQGGCGTYRYAIATGQLVRVDLAEAAGNSNCYVRAAAGTDGVVVFDSVLQLLAEDADSAIDVYRTRV